VRDAWVKKLPADHPKTLAALDNLTVAYLTARRVPEAIALGEEAATGMAKRRFQNESAAGVIRHTVEAYFLAEQFDKAEGWMRQWVPVSKQRGDSSAYAGDLAMLSFSLLQQKKWADAEAILRECLAIRERIQPDNPRTFNTRSMLGGALLGQQKYAD